MIQKESRVVVALLFLILVCFLVTSSGCSVVMAIRQPPYKDVSVLTQGRTRAEVVAELGAPILTEEKDGKKKDVFAFKQGYASGNKALRAFFHATADLFTLFLWEIIGTPAEAIANGRDMKVEVFYDKNDYVEKVNILNGQKEKPKEEPKKEPAVKEVKEPNKNFGP